MNQSYLEKMENAPYIAGLFFIIAAIVAWSSSKSNKAQSKLPPGPSGWPLTGNLLDLAAKPMHTQVTEWSRQYGEIFSFKLGQVPVVVLSGPQVFEDLLVKKGAIYTSRPTASNPARMCLGEPPAVISAPYGAHWKKLRKVLQQILGMQNAKTYKTYQERESRGLLANLLRRPDDFFEEVSTYSGSVTFSLLLGARFSSNNDRLPKLLGAGMRLLFNHIRPGNWLVDLVPFLDHLPDILAPWRRKARSFNHDFMQFWSTFTNHMKRRVKAGTAPDCFLARLLQDESFSDLSEDTITKLSAAILEAGTDSTSFTLRWFFKASTKYPDFVRVAQEELDHVVGSARMPKWDDQPNLPYIQAVIMELHRWSSIAPLAFPHATSAADTYQDWSYPAGTMILENIGGIHSDPSIYPCPDRFAPERFLPVTDARHNQQYGGLDHHYAFGTGRRICPGLQVADSSLFIAISRILWAFDLGPKKGALIDNKLVGTDVLVIGPGPFECSIKPRSQQVERIVQEEAETVANSEMEDASAYLPLLLDAAPGHVRRLEEVILWKERNPLA